MQFTKLLSPLIDAIFPNKCIACKADIQNTGALCHECWQKIDFISKPLCNKCGMPCSIPICNCNLITADCLRSATIYNPLIQKIIFNLKYYDNTKYIANFATWMIAISKEMLQHTDILIPVPMYTKRLKKRGYNQAALIAKAISKKTGIAIKYDILQKIKDTDPQAGLNRGQRYYNLQDAFAIKNSDLFGKNVTIVDDVFTTGSTTRYCSNLLKLAGASKVNILVLAVTCIAPRD